MLMSFPSFYNAAKEYLQASNPPAKHGVLAGGLHFDNLLLTSHSRRLTALDIRCDYLQQLSILAMQKAYAPEVLQQAYSSAYTAKIHTTAKELLTAANEETQLLLQNPQRLSGMLSNRLLGELGLLNTVSIKLQDPNATQLFTYQQLQRLGIAVHKDSAPLFVFAPSQQGYFRRDGMLVQLQNATKDEKLLILGGELKVERSVLYLLNKYYDIGQLKLNRHDRAQLAKCNAPSDIEYQAIDRMIHSIRDQNGVQLKLVNASVSGMGEKSLFDPNNRTIYLTGQLAPRQRLWELNKRLCEAVIHVTSNSAAPTKELEWRLMAAQMSHRWSVSPDKDFAKSITQAFDNIDKASVGHDLEGITCRVGYAVKFISNNLEQITAEQAQEQLPSLEQEQFAQQQSTRGSSLENFMEGID